MVRATAARGVFDKDAKSDAADDVFFARIVRIVAALISLFVASRALDLDILFRGGSLLDCARAQSLFAWHPSAMALGMLWLFSEAWLAIRARRGLKGSARIFQVQLHLAFVLAATALGSFGFWAIYSNKTRAGKDHFTSNHGKVGLAAMVLMWCNVLHGLFVRGGFGSASRSWMQWRSALHRSLGTLAFVFSLTAVALGLVSGWGMKKLQGFQTPNAAGPTVGPYVLVLLVALVGLCALCYGPSERGAAADSAKKED